MPDHAFRVALRNMKRHKGFAFLNISGLAVGLAATMLIFLWVRDERSYDRFHADAERIFRVVFSTSDDGAPTNANGSFGVGPALKKDFPEVLETARIRKMEGGPKRYVGYRDKRFYESRFFFAEPAVLSVFDFPLIRGDAATALAAPGAVVLTEDTAKKYFGNEDPIGKTIEADPYNEGNPMLFRVTGIAKNVPRTSHFHFDLLASYASMREDTRSLDGFHQHYTYVLLKSRAAAESLRPKLREFLHRTWRPDPWYTLGLQPLLDIRLHSGLRSEIEPTGSILYVYVFTAIAISVLLIAAINFMNLATARASKRAKEIGVRKTVGAPKARLVRQFLGESLAFSLMAAAAAVLLAALALPLFNRLTSKGLALVSLIDPIFLLGTAGVALGVGVLSGVYPAFFLSAFRPVQALKPRAGKTASGAALRRGLVVFQFTLSIAIICATLIIRKQMDYIQTRDPGYDKDRIMVIPLNKELRQNYESFRNELLRDPGIENAATSAYVPTLSSMHLTIRFEDGRDGLSQVIYAVDEEFAGTYGLRLVAGRLPRRPLSGDGSADFLVSALTTREAGFASPRDALGRRATLDEYGGQIVGVVNDINIYSLRRQPYAVVYAVTSRAGHNYLSIRMRAPRSTKTVDFIRGVWRRRIPSFPLDFFFLDANFADLHLAEKKMGEIFSIFSVLAVFVACLGLFGLTAHTAEQKTKEIGVRKVLGASTAGVYALLSREFLKWVALANLIAWPVAYYAMHSWLRNFAFRTTIGWEVFPVSGATALIVACLTVSGQSIKAASANPVNALRYE